MTTFKMIGTSITSRFRLALCKASLSLCPWVAMHLFSYTIHRFAFCDVYIDSIIYLCVCRCVCLHMLACHSMCVDIKGHLGRVSSLFLQCGSWELNSGCLGGKGLIPIELSSDWKVFNFERV